MHIYIHTHTDDYAINMLHVLGTSTSLRGHEHIYRCVKTASYHVSTVNETVTWKLATKDIIWMVI